ncbi:MAG: PorT family protein [Bacteroidia bacterium]|nr:PorT family protein [Bacteroidia bacterium]
MKRYIVIPLLILLAGQLSAQKKYSGGLYASTGLSWMSPENVKLVENSGAGLAYKIGAELDINANDNFAFCLSMQYGQNRASVSFIDTVKTFKTTDGDYFIKPKTKISYKLNFVDVPVFLKFKTNEIGYITYLLKAGAITSIGLTPRGTFVGTNSSNQEESVADAIVSKEVTPINFGVILGGGIEYNFGANAKLLIELNYNRNLIDNLMTETWKNGAEINPVARLNTVELKVGILF